MLRKNKLWLALINSLLALVSTKALAQWELNMPEGITGISRATYNLHMTIIIVCVVIALIVYGVLAFSLIKYRKSKGAVPAKFHHSTKVEVIWTVVPFLILIGMAIPSTRVLTQIYDASESDLDIVITGYQWRWQYRYLNEGGEEVSFFSNLATPDEQIYNVTDKGENYLLEVDQPLVIPVGRKVRLLLTSADVIHSWWVPDFAVKKDAIPGFMNESWVVAEQTGTYRGQCTELCGQDHGFMPIVVNVVSQEEFDAWLGEKQAAAAEIAQLASQDFTVDQLVERGQGVYNTYCVACHQANGQGLPPAFPPLAGSPIATGPVAGHADVVLNGRPGTAMAAYRNQLNPVDLAAVITFERNSFGNTTGDMISPVEILQLLQAGQ
jgi:cytochrome c oxidase subunit 2